MKYYNLIVKGHCPYCIEAISILEQRQEQFIYTDMENCESMLKQTQDDINYNTVPMIWQVMVDIDGDQSVRFIGGCDALKEHFETQE
jgi:glutaredoxin-related protein